MKIPRHQVNSVYFLLFAFLSIKVHRLQQIIVACHLFDHFGPRVYPRVLSNRLCPLVHGPSVGQSLNISETVHWFFLIFCMKLEQHKGTKVTEPDF